MRRNPSFVRLLLSFSLISICCLAQTELGKLTAIGDAEVREHLIGDPPIIRATLPGREAAILGMEGIAVKVVVDEGGSVVSATPDASAPAKLQSQSKVAALATRYRPFERNGRAVSASFEERVAVLPPELTPKSRVPFPTIRNLDSIRITLRRTGCFGACPAYRVELHGNGSVLYNGQGYVALMGPHRGSVPQENVAKLVEAFRSADYYSLQSEYVWGATDLPTYETSIEIDGRAKSVRDYAGAMVGMPLSVSKLESEIDRLTDVERWTKGNEHTSQALLEEKWNFKSREATDTLSRIAQYGSIDAIQGLLAAGVTVDSNSRSASDALSQAAFRGDVQMLDSLLEAGLRRNTEAMDTALLRAASAGGYEAAGLLLADGASPNARDASGGTLLMSAAQSGRPKLVERVLAFDPDVNARNVEGRTALMQAVGQWHFGPEGPEIKRAEVVELLLRHGADPNLKDERGNTALIECAWDADAALVLVKYGANINAQSSEGFTPLMNTSAADVARVLIDNGADLFVRDKEGKTALELARQYGQKEKAALLEAAQARK